MTDMEKLKKVLDEIGIKYEMTDDSEESGFDEMLDTVVQINDKSESRSIYFMFKRDGKFKSLTII